MITFPNQPIKIQAFVETGEYGNILRTGCFVLTEKELAANQENLKGLLARKKQELKKAMGIK